MAHRKSPSSELDRAIGSSFLPSFDGSQLLSHLERSQTHVILLCKVISASIINQGH